MADWKWYVRAEDKSIFWSPEVPPRSIEVEAPPVRDYIWDFDLNRWVFDIKEKKMLAQQYATSEMQRVVKFSMINVSDELMTTLRQYHVVLQDYVNNFSESSVIPPIPETLREEAFYSSGG